MKRAPATGAERSAPLTLGIQDEPIFVLAAHSERLATIVETLSKRSDVQNLAARLLILLLEKRCPHSRGHLYRPWYVPGAVARLSSEGIRRAWHYRFGTTPPYKRTVLTHLRRLERAEAIVRQPGEWKPERDGNGEEHPFARRWADTLHVLETDEQARQWLAHGAGPLRRNPLARTNPDVWRRVIPKNWRYAPIMRQLELFEQEDQGAGPEGERAETTSSRSRRSAPARRPAPPPPPPSPAPPRPAALRAVPSAEGFTLPGLPPRPSARTLQGEPVETRPRAETGIDRGRALARALRSLVAERDPDALDFLIVLERSAGPFPAAVQAGLAADLGKLRGVAALLARRLEGGDVIRDRTAWVLHAHRMIDRAELTRAWAWVTGYVEAGGASDAPRDGPIRDGWGTETRAEARGALLQGDNALAPPPLHEDRDRRT